MTARPRFLRFAALFLITLQLAVPAAAADQIDEYILSQLKTRNIPGLSLAVVRDGRVARSGT